MRKQLLAGLTTFACTTSMLTMLPAQVVVGADDYLFHSTFESTTDSWAGRGSATVQKSSDAHYVGSGSLYVRDRTDAWNGASLALDSAFTAGTAYSFSANVCFLTGSTTDTFYLKLQYTDASGETAYDGIAEGTAVQGDWMQLANKSYTIPAGASDLQIYVETASSTYNFYIDEAIGAADGTVIAGAVSNPFVLGDLDGDGAITAADFSLAKLGLRDGFTRKRAQMAADLDKDRTVSVTDLVWLQKFIAGEVTEYPEPVEPLEEFDDFQYEANMAFRAIPDSYKRDCAQKGTLIKLNYNSCHGNKGTYANVYLPYGYDENDTTKKYNVFYLMHGGGENQDTLFGQEKFNVVLDNMIMNGVLKPLIVVTPTFNSGDVSNFYQELLQNLMPLVESKYHTYAKSTSAEDLKASRYHRAFGGFSMGSVCTWHCFLNALDYIAYFMPLSGDSWVGNSSADKARVLADHVKKSGYKPDEYFVFCATGVKDIAYPNISPQIEEMKKYPEQFIYTSDLSKGNFYFLTWSEGVHWWPNVLNYIYDILPSFFHES